MENETNVTFNTLTWPGTNYRCETFINSVATATNYADQTYTRIGDNAATGQGTNFMALRFQLTDYIPAGSRITRAELNLTIQSKNWVGQSSAVVNLRRYLGSWRPDTITYANQPSFGDIVASHTRYSADKTLAEGVAAHAWFMNDSAFIAMLQDMLDNPGANYGFRLSGTAITPDGDRNAHNFYNSNSGYPNYIYSPKLLVYYVPDGPPAVETYDPTAVDHHSAVMHGAAIDDGGAGPVYMGALLIAELAWAQQHSLDFSASPSYGVQDVALDFHPGVMNYLLYSSVNDGAFPYPIDGAVSGLSPGNTYVYRAMAWNQHTSTLLARGYGGIKYITTKSINAFAGMGGAGKTHALRGSIGLGWGGDGAGKPGAVIGHSSQSTGGASSTSGNGADGQDGSGSGGGGAGPGGTGGKGGSGIVVVRYKTEDAISAEYVTDAKAFNPSIAFQRGKLYTPYYVAGSKVTVNVTTIGSGTSPLITCADALTGLVNGMGVTIVNSGSAAIDGNWIVGNVNLANKTFTITPGTTVTGNTPTGCKATFNAYVGVQRTADLLAPIGWLKTSRSAMEMMTIKKKFKYISVIHEPFENNESIACSYTLDGTEYAGVADVQSPTETLFPIHKDGYGVDVTLSLTSDTARSVSPKVTAIHVVWSFVKNKVHQYSLLCVKGANGGKWNKNPKKAIQYLFANAGDVLTFEERFAGSYQGTIDSVDFNQGQASLSDDASGLVRLTVVEET